ncbi:MAG: PEP-CTERM sorting domain-containing protein [Saprospiraceae bacterium]|nr:PEP-CTERM sorting domain-containing protein [Saprospiraceae bacterium]
MFNRSIFNLHEEIYKMKFQKTMLALAFAGSAMSAQAAQVTELVITGGDFAMGAAAGLCGSGGPFGNHQCLTAGSTIDTDDGLFEGPSLTAFNFFGAPVTTFTAASAVGAAASLTGNPITGDATGTTITLDLGSFYANWSGTNFLQAPNGTGIATGTWTATSATTGTFDISWSSLISTAPFAGQTGNWHLVGTATIAAVPEASTYGMMLAGLGLVGGMVSRRRKLVA